MSAHGISLVKGDSLDGDPGELSAKALEELIEIMRRVEQEAQVNCQPMAAAWFHTTPFPGVRYYSYD